MTGSSTAGPALRCAGNGVTRRIEGKKRKLAAGPCQGRFHDQSDCALPAAKYSNRPHRTVLSESHHAAWTGRISYGAALRFSRRPFLGGEIMRSFRTGFLDLLEYSRSDELRQLHLQDQIAAYQNPTDFSKLPPVIRVDIASMLKELEPLRPVFEACEQFVAGYRYGLVYAVRFTGPDFANLLNRGGSGFLLRGELPLDRIVGKAKLDFHDLSDVAMHDIGITLFPGPARQGATACHAAGNGPAKGCAADFYQVLFGRRARMLARRRHIERLRDGVLRCRKILKCCARNQFHVVSSNIDGLQLSCASRRSRFFTIRLLRSVLTRATSGATD